MLAPCTRTPLRIALALGLLLGLSRCDWPAPKAVDSCTEVTVPKVTIKSQTDWNGIKAKLERAAGKTTNPAASYLLQKVSVAADLEKVYLRIEATVPNTATRDAGGRPDLGTCGNGSCDPGEQGKCSIDCPGGGNNCGDGICEGGEESSCPDDCVQPELRINLKATGGRSGEVSVSRGGSSSSTVSWNVHGNWHGDEGGGPNIVCGGGATATPGGLVAEVWISRKELGELVSLYPTSGRCCTNNQGPSLDDEIGCVWFRLDATAKPDGSIPDKPSSCPGGGVLCNKLCCKAGEVCSKDDTCCAPDCSNRICGPDPICGSSCGTCATKAKCSGNGLCEVTSPTWSQIYTPDTVQLDSIWGSNGRVWTVGRDTAGAAIFEYQSALNWQRVASRPGGHLHQIHGNPMTSEVWAVGKGGILYLNGASWVPEGPTDDLTGVWSSTSPQVWAVGPGGKVMRRGGSWAPEANQPPTKNDLNALWGTDAGLWGIVGDKTILRWTGSGWDNASSATLMEPLYGISGFSPSDVWVVGNKGTVMHFDGSSWTHLKTGSTATLHGVWATAEKEAWAVGAGGTILQLSGNSVAHVKSASLANAELRGVWASSPTDVWAVGTDGLTLHTGP